MLTAIVNAVEVEYVLDNTDTMINFKTSLDQWQSLQTTAINS